MTCACGNAARYVAADGRLTCALCPLRDGVDSVRLSDVPALLAAARRFVVAVRGPRPDVVELAGIAADVRSVLGRPPG